jgi:hypothetical protein
MIPPISQYELHQMKEYERQQAEERRKLGLQPSRAAEVLTVLFWSVLGLIVLWNASVIPWIGIIKVVGLWIGWVVVCGVFAAIVSSLM